MPLAATSAPPAPKRHWLRRGLWGLGLLGALLVLAVWLGLDPWLRRTLEQQVTKQTHGQYRLAISSLRTRLLPRAVHLRGLDLRPTGAALADTLPRLHLRLARLDLSGVGLLALLRGQTVPLDTLVLDSLHLRVRHWPGAQRPTRGPQSTSGCRRGWATWRCGAPAAASARPGP
ncbi:hypothetical protein, partial [Hymenobacter coccineus]|uniref:hypothetical protein n=1 Tax=Hymenobacter coccineus TaxID=1908235 RepID=UPI00114D113F